MNKHIILLFIVFFSCKNSETPKVLDVPKIELSDIDDAFFKWENVTSTIECVALETNTNSEIGSLHKGLVYEKTFFLFDLFNRRFQVFDEQGNWKHSFQKGKGPGEILDMRDFSIYDNKLYILDYLKIHIFNVNNFDFVETETLKVPKDKGFNPDGIACFGKGNYFLWNSTSDEWDKSKGNYYCLYKMRNSNILEKLYKYQYKTSMGAFFQNKEKCYLKPSPWSYSIVEIKAKDKEIAPVIDLDFGDKAINLEKYIAEISKTKMNEINCFFGISDIYQMGSTLFFTCIGPQSKLYQGLINKNTLEVIQFGRFKPGTPFIFYANDEWIYGYLNASVLIELSNDEPANPFVVAAKSIIEKLNVASNPIIVKMKLDVK